MKIASFAGATPAGSSLAVLVRGYQLLLRPLMAPACRFEPSCSAYAIEALRTHGAARGLALTAWRILRCNPWGGCGHDPVPSSLRAAGLSLGRSAEAPAEASPMHRPGQVQPRETIGWLQSPNRVERVHSPGWADGACLPADPSQSLSGAEPTSSPPRAHHKKDVKAS